MKKWQNQIPIITKPKNPKKQIPIAKIQEIIKHKDDEKKDKLSVSKPNFSKKRGTEKNADNNKWLDCKKAK